MNNMTDKISIDLNRLSGRKKICAVLPYQGRLIITFMSDGKNRKESDISDGLRSAWGRDTLDRGRITHFCRCIKDVEGRFMFEVSGNRPRDIQFIRWDDRQA